MTTKIVKDFTAKILYKFILDRNRPKYFPFLYWFCKSYVDLYNGDGIADRETNGGWKWLKEYCATNPKVIFDVGTYNGEYLKKIQEYSPDTKIYAFEPSPESFEKYKFEGNVIHEQLAISDFEGKATLYSRKDEKYHATDSLHRMDKGRHIHDKSYEVQCTTIDKYCEENKIGYIDLLKIDTEGNDFKVLRGAERMLREGKIGQIQFEFSWQYTFSHVYLNDFYDFLKPLGYMLYKIKHNGLELVKDPVMERTVYAYFVAKHEL